MYKPTSALITLSLGVLVARADALLTEAHRSGFDTLEEVIVTAQRREENLQSVPIAVTALSGDELRRLQINDVNRLQYAVPSLVIWPVIGNSNTATISLRGQVEPDLLPTNDPAVGTYLDGVYIARMTGANLELVDMQRVEVLRGPQGTLFGRNAIGGAINLISNPPVRQFEGNMTAEIGNFSSADLTGVINFPVDLYQGALRVVAKHSEHRGYGRAVLLGRDLSDDDTNYVRTQLALTPADDCNLTLAADLTTTRSSSQLVTFVAAFGDTNQIPGLSGNPTDTLAHYAQVTDGNVQSNRAGGFDARVWGISGTLTDTLSWGTVKSITAFRRLDLGIDNSDMDGTPYDLFGLIERRQSEHQVSEELQLHGTNSSGRSNWTAGVMYFSETAQFNAHNAFLVPLSDSEVLTRAVAKNDSAAVYAQLTQTVTPRVSLTGGVRYNVDWRQLISQNALLQSGSEVCRLDASILDVPGSCRATLPRRNFSYTPFTFGIDYQSREGALFYAKVSRGQRAGGYNMRGGTPTGLLTFDPERVTSYELGTKADLLEQRLRIDLALYQSDYDDIQLGADILDPIVHDTVFIKQNGGRGRILGGELEVTALLGRLRLSSALGVADGKYLELAPFVSGVTVSSELVLPKTTASIAGDLPIQSQFGRLYLHVDYGWHSDDLDPPTQARCLCHNAYGLLNVTIRLAPMGGHLEFGLWAHNLAGTRFKAQLVDFDSFIDAVPGDPRTYGVMARYEFGVGASDE